MVSLGDAFKVSPIRSIAADEDATDLLRATIATFDRTKVLGGQPIGVPIFPLVAMGLLPAAILDDLDQLHDVAGGAVVDHALVPFDVHERNLVRPS